MEPSYAQPGAQLSLITVFAEFLAMSKLPSAMRYTLTSRI